MKMQITQQNDEISADPNVEAVIQKHRERASVGLSKYGVTTERKDLSFFDWLNHAQDELMDGAIYLERIKEAAREQDSFKNLALELVEAAKEDREAACGRIVLLEHKAQNLTAVACAYEDLVRKYHPAYNQPADTTILNPPPTMLAALEDLLSAKADDQENIVQMGQAIMRLDERIKALEQ